MLRKFGSLTPRLFSVWNCRERLEPLRGRIDLDECCLVRLTLANPDRNARLPARHYRPLTFPR